MSSELSQHVPGHSQCQVLLIPASPLNRVVDRRALKRPCLPACPVTFQLHPAPGERLCIPEMSALLDLRRPVPADALSRCSTYSRVRLLVNRLGLFDERLVNVKLVIDAGFYRGSSGTYAILVAEITVRNQAVRYSEAMSWSGVGKIVRPFGLQLGASHL